MITRRHRPFRILLVEDNVPDIELMKFMLGSCGVPIDLHFAANGVEAVNFVLKRGTNAGSPTPDLIILDLNTPLKDGYEVLRELKSSRPSSVIPVVVFSSSSSDREVEEAYFAGATAFITKPTDIAHLEDMIKRLVGFWCGGVRLSTYSEIRGLGA